MEDLFVNINISALEHTNDPRRRVDLSQFVVSYTTSTPGIRTLRHAWNPKNKRAVCSAVVKATHDEPFVTDYDNNCRKCQRQWDEWQEMRGQTE